MKRKSGKAEVKRGKGKKEEREGRWEGRRKEEEKGEKDQERGKEGRSKEEAGKRRKRTKLTFLISSLNIHSPLRQTKEGQEVTPGVGYFKNIHSAEQLS